MIDIFDLYQSFQSFVNTYSGGWYRPQTDFLMACNDISLEIWETWTRQAEKSQEIKDNLRPFLKSKNVIVSSQNTYYGLMAFPTGYERYSTARILYHEDKTFPDKSIDNGVCDGVSTQEEINEKYYENISESDIDLVDDQKWGACLSHKTKNPTLQKPKMMQIENGFRVSPRQVSVVVLDYYIKPKLATFVYTKAPGDVQTGAGDQLIYDKSNSIPLEWPATVRNEFLIRLGQRYGLFTRSQFVSQVSTTLKQTS